MRPPNPYVTIGTIQTPTYKRKLLGVPQHWAGYESACRSEGPLTQVSGCKVGGAHGVIHVLAGVTDASQRDYRHVGYTRVVQHWSIRRLRIVWNNRLTVVTLLTEVRGSALRLDSNALRGASL